MRGFIINQYAKYIAKKVNAIRKNALQDQERIFKQLVQKASQTQFGNEHEFESIKNYQDFKSRVPINDYEGLRNYFDQLVENKATDILWPGQPKYFAKTSGTTSGVKYIPISRESMPYHIMGARLALLNQIALKPKPVLDQKVIFISGSPELTMTNGISTGRLSGIVNHEIPFWLKRNQLPTYETNCIDDWETKVDKIVEETKNQDLRLISGIPPWVQMYFEKLLESTGKSNVKEVFPNFELFVYGGVNYQPYKSSMDKLIGSSIDTLETYPASEGFIAFQDRPNNPELLLYTDGGIFYEFIPLQEVHSKTPTRLSLKDVELNKDYAIVINNNAGLWGYLLGDTVSFTSLAPYRLRVSGRIKHYISAFGEHVIGKEVEETISIASKKFNLEIVDFTVAPQINPSSGLPYHEWLIEFSETPKNLLEIELAMDEEMLRQNIYYRDLIVGSVLQSLKITPLQKNAFRNFMKRQGKLGGQNKVPKLSNDRKIADLLNNYKEG